MAEDYLIASTKVLPEGIEKVIAAREALASHQAATVTEAVKKAGISRNAYYKYKDLVFRPGELKASRKASYTLSLEHRPGALSAVLAALSRANASILTIAQSLPVAGTASVTMALDISEIRGTLAAMTAALKGLGPVRSVHLDSME